MVLAHTKLLALPLSYDLAGPNNLVPEVQLLILLPSELCGLTLANHALRLELIAHFFTFVVGPSKEPSVLGFGVFFAVIIRLEDGKVFRNIKRVLDGRIWPLTR